jgi:hypothetical protein
MNSLFIGYVSTNVSAARLEILFADTFDSEVTVRFSKERKNKYGLWYKSATIEVHSMSPSLNHFLSQVTLHGNNTFIGDHETYKVQFAEDTTPSPMRKFTPLIM